jgi:hypothetical protein
MAVVYPTIGMWFRRPNRALFEVVAVDETGGTVEIQFFDGTISEVDLENWPDLLITEASAPEDWSGSVDMDPEDFAGENNGDIPMGFHDPLDFLDRIG